MTATHLKQLNLIGEDLKRLRQPYEALYRELGDNFSPTRTRFNKGKKAGKIEERWNNRLINTRPRYALRTMQSGMHSGITSPARPWFRLIPEDPSLRNNTAMKEHLTAAQREMRQLLQTSGLYSVIHMLWRDLGLFGTDAAIIEDDVTSQLRGQALVPGEYWLGSDGRNVIDTLYREIEMTVKQVVSKFVFKGNPGNEPDWSNVSNTIKSMWDNGNYSERIDIRHLITPREDRDLRSPLARDKPIASTYWEASESSKVLGDLGYDKSPIVASRWDTIGTDVYGASPAMDALGDAKGLQAKERDKAEAIRRMNRPPMNVPVEMRNSAFSFMPEALNFMSDPTRGAVPSYSVNPPIGDLIGDIRDAEQRVDEGLYANLFLMIARLDRREITAREIDERHEEKLLGLGPVLERQHEEKLAVILRRLYSTVVQNGRVPPLPPELAGSSVKIDYISTLGQAMKAVATGGMERLYGFVGNLSAVDETVLDKLDNDAAIDEYADMVGVPNDVVRPDEKVSEVRQERARQQQAAVAADRAEQAAGTAQKGAQAASVLADAGQPRGPRDILGELGLTR